METSLEASFAASLEESTFVDNWIYYKTILGEGAYGEVRLLINKNTHEKVACKIVDICKHKDAIAVVNKETMIHKMLAHENIIKYFGRRQEPEKEYIFLEYAPGGELFQLIEPDVGMSAGDAQHYMKNLLSGLEYLHQNGITHRDIKPENLLVSAQGVLKISDFGLATIFRLKGRERLLEKVCGTKPYMAPEIRTMSYPAKPADLWACGIVFVTMLTGEMPWDSAEPDDEDFLNWCNDDYLSVTPWSKLGNTALSLARQILNAHWEKRPTLIQILHHPWMRFNFEDSPEHQETKDNQPHSGRRFNSIMETETRHRRDSPQVTLSQPAMAIRPTSIDELVNDIKIIRKRDSMCFSQPTKNDDFILPFAPSSFTRENFPNLFQRMTRFYVNCKMGVALEYLGLILDGLHYSWTLDVAGTVTISTVDSRKNPLVFKTNFLEMDGKLLADFRLSKGCGLEFKKQFIKLKSCLTNIIIDWDSSVTVNGSRPISAPSNSNH